MTIRSVRLATRLVLLAASLFLVLSSLMVERLDAAEPAPPQRPPGAPTLEAMLPDLHLLEPVWSSPTIHGESLIFVSEEPGQPAVGKLLYPAEKIVSVRRADGAQTFEAGRDFKLQAGGRSLELTTGSRIPALAAAELFPPAGAPRSIPHKTGDPARSVLFDNEHWFHDQQVEVTYQRANEEWSGKTPALAKEHLPQTLARLRNKEKLVLAVSGDSISEGYNASGFSGAPPWMPPYPDLVAAQLRASYGGEVELKNRAVGGWSVANGQKDLDELLKFEPHLIVIAYGMNDVGRRDPKWFRESIGDMLTRIRQHNADTEVILVATMLGNRDWVATPREMFAPYRDALASFVGPGVALADLTDLWEHVLTHKRDVDVNGNGVNHPSDFGHRMYAQVILALLVGNED